MQRYIQRIVAVLFLFASFSGGNYEFAAHAEEPAVASGELGSPLPNFSLKDLRGRTVSSADLRGKVVLIDFWATWCQPCKKEMPGYQKLMDQYGAKGLRVIGFKADMMRDQVDPLLFVKKLGVRYPIVVATKETRDKFGGIEGLPTTRSEEHTSELQ